MPDLLAGTIVNALDTPPTVQATQAGNFSFTTGTYAVTTTAGTYVDCGVAFTACTTGRALVSIAGALNGSGAAVFALLSFVVRNGSTVGAGTTFLAADDMRCIMHAGTNAEQDGATFLVTGLTPGNAYNVRLEHRQAGGTGTIERRTVVVAPAT